MGRGRRTLATVLRLRPYREADRVAVLLTREMGKVDALVSGARKPRSRLRGLVLPFCEGDLWIHERRGRSLYVLTGGRPVARFLDDQDAAEAAVLGAASYVVELADRLLPPGEGSGAVYDLVRAALRALGQSARAKAPGGARTVTSAFALKMLAHTGFRPPLWSCIRCGARGTQEAFDLTLGGSVCSRCDRARGDGAAVLSSLRRLEQARLADVGRGDLGAVSADTAHAIRVLALRVLEAPLRSERFLSSLPA